MFKCQLEDDPWRVETLSCLNYYFYKVVFLTVVNLLLSRRTRWTDCVECSRTEIFEEFSEWIWRRESIWYSLGWMAG